MGKQLEHTDCNKFCRFFHTLMIQHTKYSNHIQFPRKVHKSYQHNFQKVYMVMYLQEHYQTIEQTSPFMLPSDHYPSPTKTKENNYLNF